MPKVVFDSFREQSTEHIGMVQGPWDGASAINNFCATRGDFSDAHWCISLTLLLQAGRRESLGWQTDSSTSSPEGGGGWGRRREGGRRRCSGVGSGWSWAGVKWAEGGGRRVEGQGQDPTLCQILTSKGGPRPSRPMEAAAVLHWGKG